VEVAVQVVDEEKAPLGARARAAVGVLGGGKGGKRAGSAKKRRTHFFHFFICSKL